MENKPTTTEQLSNQRHEGAFSGELQFESAQRIAKAISTATNIPEAYRGNVANTLVALEMAYRMNASPLMVMQNMDIIHGKPAFSAKFAIALINDCGRYTPLRYEYSGEGDGRQCRAYATERATGEILRGPVVSIAMAKAEGWFTRSGSKWKNMPELMLAYRAAAFWQRLYEPGLVMGLSAEELHDIAPSTAAPVQDLNARLQKKEPEFTEPIHVETAQPPAADPDGWL